jgi:hypothetical protein
MLHERFTDDAFRPAESYEQEASHLHSIEEQVSSLTAAAEPLPEPGPPPSYEPPVTPVTPILPAGTVALDDLVRIERAWRREIQQVIIPELEKTMRAAADAVLESISFEAPVLWDASHPAAQLFLTQTANQLVGVGEDMWERTRDQLIMGMQKGDSIQQLSARVKEVLSTTDTRARMIARTEVIGASNAGAMQQLEMLGEDAPAQKTWLATRDGRTRLSHAAANGQTVDFVMPFTVGGAKFDYPGDPDAPADERINCRCTLTWHFADLPLQSIRSAGALEMFSKPGDPYHRDNHGRFAPKGGGGGASGGEKKILKPAHVDTKRLNSAEAAELADIQAKHKAGELSDKEAKYKTYYVKVKASKRINKSGGGGGAGGAEKKLEPEKTPTPPWKEPGYAGHNKKVAPTSDVKIGDTVDLPSGGKGTVAEKIGGDSFIVTSPSGDASIIHKDKLKKSAEPKISYAPSSGMKDAKPLGPTKPANTLISKGDTVKTPTGEGKVLGSDTKNVMIEHSDGSIKVHPIDKVSKTTSKPGTKIDPGEAVDTPGGPGHVIKKNDKGVLVEHHDGSQDVYRHQDVKPGKSSATAKPPEAKPSSTPVTKGDRVMTPKGEGKVTAEYGNSVYVQTADKNVYVYQKHEVTKTHAMPSASGGTGSSSSTPKSHAPAPAKKFTKPSEVKETQLNPAEYDELYSLTKANKDGTLSDAEFKKKAYYVKVKASKRINKNAGVSKPTPGGGLSSDVPSMKSGGGGGIKLNPGGLDITPSSAPEVPAVLKSKYTLTRKTANKNAELTQSKLRSDLTDAKHKPGAWDDPVIGPQLKAHSAYTGSSYGPINTLAREGKLPYGGEATAAKHIKNLDSAFHTYGTTVSQPIVVHRGVRGSYSQDLKKLQPGDVITERGFMSTSIYDKKPKDFAGSSGTLMEIAVHPGKRTMAGTDYEHELLFPRNTKMQYLGRSQSGALQFTMIE